MIKRYRFWSSIIIKKNKRSITHDIKKRSIFKHNKKELEENYYDTQIIFGRYQHTEVRFMSVYYDGPPSRLRNSAFNPLTFLDK